MSQFIESIAIRRGEVSLLMLHQDRVDRTFASFYPGMIPHDLSRLLLNQAGDLLKCRVVYDAQSAHIEYQRYTIPEIRSLKVIESNGIDYSFKSADRNELHELFSRRENCDDILIVKNGFVTDSYFANVALFNGKKWITPDCPLLHGVKRRHLINKGLLIEKKISVADLKQFKVIALINAMLDLEEVVIPVDCIKF